MNKIRKLICVLLVPVIVSLCACGSSDDNDNDTNVNQTKYTTAAGYVKKTETVYVNLDNSGNRTQTVVSDWLHTTKGQVYVNDITNLTEIQNIKDDSMPDVNGQNLKWYMDSTDLYYQGKTDAALPLNFKITYYLNNKEMTPEQISGKSGKLKINIQMENVDSSTVTVNGKNMTMYNPMLVVGGITMDESKFQNISVQNGKTVGDANKQYVVLVGFPGINDSLGLTEMGADTATDSAYNFNDNFVITTDVTNFELGNFMFAAVPIASLDIGLNSISSSMDDVRENLSKLQNVQESLKAIDADSLLSTLSSNPDKLNSLSSLVDKASSLYTDNKALIDVLNKYATPENMKTIQALSDYVSTADFEGLGTALDAINSIFGNDASAEKIQQGLSLLKQMSDDLSDPNVKKAIQNLPNTVSTLSSLQAAINENKQLINVLKTLSESDVLSSIGNALSDVEGSLAADGLSQYANITGNADEITAKMTAWIELGKSYSIFTKKSNGMDSSVMFVFKVDSLKTDNEKDESEVAKESATEVEESSGLKGIFNKIFKK